MTPGMIMAAAGVLGSIACLVFLISTARRFQKQRKRLLEEIRSE